MLYLEGGHRQYAYMGRGILVQRVVVDLSNCKYGKRRTEERRHERGAKNPAQRGLWLEISLASFRKLRHLHSGGHALRHYEESARICPYVLFGDIQRWFGLSKS